MHGVKDIILKSLIIEYKNKYEYQKTLVVSGKDKEKEPLEVDKREKLPNLP